MERRRARSIGPLQSRHRARNQGDRRATQRARDEGGPGTGGIFGEHRHDPRPCWAAAAASVLHFLAVAAGEPEHRGGHAIGAAEAVGEMALIAEAGGGGDRRRRLARFEETPCPREPALQHVIPRLMDEANRANASFYPPNQFLETPLVDGDSVKPVLAASLQNMAKAGVIVEQ